MQGARTQHRHCGTEPRVIRPRLTSTEREQFDIYDSHFAEEGDRGAVVLAGAYLDHLLEDALDAHSLRAPVDCSERVPTSARKSRMRYNERVSAATSLQLVSEYVGSDLKILGKIRNHFAHEFAGATFADPRVQDHCESLSTTRLTTQFADDIRSDASKIARMRFVLAVQLAMFAIHRSKPDLVRWP